MNKLVVALNGPIAYDELTSSGASFVASRVFFNRLGSSTEHVDDSSFEADLTIDKLWETRIDPLSSKINCSIDSVDILQKELELLKGPVVVLDIATFDRNLSTLLALSKRLRQDIQLICCASPSIISGKSLEEISDELVVELSLGVEARHAVDRAKIKPGAIGFYLSNAAELSACEILCLQGCAIAQRRCPGVPIVVELQPWSQLHTRVADILRQSGADIGSVIMCGTVLSSETVDYFAKVLVETAVPGQDNQLCICVDTLGATQLPAKGMMYPSDEEISTAIQKLLLEGNIDRVILSPSIRFRMDFRCYGGPGYSYVGEVCRSRMSGVRCPQFTAADTLRRLCSSNGVNKVAWFVPEPPAPVELKKLKCHICKSEFIPGDHFEKFSFVYCSSKCLGFHRKSGWS